MRPAAHTLVEHPDNPPDARDVVVLVHGTYQPEAAWTLPASDLSREVRRTLPDVALYRFRWTGRNSHQARLDAGSALRADLMRLRAAVDGRRIGVVTHSHGGNVLMYALAAGDTRVDGAVCMATPFLYVRDVGSRLSFWDRYFIVLMTALGLVGLWWAGVMAWRVGFYVDAILLYALALVAVVVLSAFVVALARHGTAARTWPLALPTVPQDVLLLLRPAGDEAAGGLGAAHLASLVLEVIWRHGRRIVQTLATVWLASIVGIGVLKWASGWLAVRSSDTIAQLHDIVILAFIGGQVLVGLCAVVLLTTMAICQCAFGRDALVLTLRAITSVEDSPPGVQTVHQIQIERDPTATATLDHSRLYADPGVIREVVAFLRHRLPAEPAATHVDATDRRVAGAAAPTRPR